MEFRRLVLDEIAETLILCKRIRSGPDSRRIKSQPESPRALCRIDTLT